MRYQVSALGYMVLALLLGAGVVWLGFYASGADTYYSTGVSRWEHASRAGSTTIVLAALVIASAAAIAAFIQGLFPRRFVLGPLVILAIAFYGVAFVVAWFFLTTGH